MITGDIQGFRPREDTQGSLAEPIENATSSEAQEVNVNPTRYDTSDARILRELLWKWRIALQMARKAREKRESHTGY